MDDIEFGYTLLGFLLGLIICGLISIPLSPVELPNGCILHDDVIYCEVAE
mgnify:CR=1 FL=1